MIKEKVGQIHRIELLKAPENYFRNQHTFLNEIIPPNYPYAERVDPSFKSIPHASYYKLDPRTDGLPIAERAAIGLLHLFEAEAMRGDTTKSYKFAQERLQWAKESLAEKNWTAAVSHAAEAYSAGNKKCKEKTKQLLIDTLTEVLAYPDFAPAIKINRLQTNKGSITVPAAITDQQELNRLTRVFNNPRAT